MKKQYKPCKIVTDNNKNKFIYIVENGNELPLSHDGLIALPASFKVSLYVEPTVKQLRKLGYTVKGSRFLSQKTGNVVTELFIAI